MSEIEKQFFDTFGIEKLVNQRYHTSIYGSIENCIEKAKEWSKETGIRIKNIEIASDELIYFDKVYRPQITDRILLELICIANQHEDYPISTNIKNIQARTLRILLRTEKLYKKYYGSNVRYKKLVKQVRALFKENN